MHLLHHGSSSGGADLTSPARTRQEVGGSASRLLRGGRALPRRSPPSACIPKLRRRFTSDEWPGRMSMEQADCKLPPLPSSGSMNCVLGGAGPRPVDSAARMGAPALRCAAAGPAGAAHLLPAPRQLKHGARQAAVQAHGDARWAGDPHGALGCGHLGQAVAGDGAGRKGGHGGRAAAPGSSARRWRWRRRRRWAQLLSLGRATQARTSALLPNEQLWDECDSSAAAVCGGALDRVRAAVKVSFAQGFCRIAQRAAAACRAGLFWLQRQARTAARTPRPSALAWLALRALAPNLSANSSVAWAVLRAVHRELPTPSVGTARR